MIARLVALVALLFVTCMAPRVAFAHMGKERPTSLGQARPSKPPTGERGRAAFVDGAPLHITPSQAGFAGSFRVKNIGAGPLRIYRVEAPTDDVGPRFPAGVSVHTTDAETKPLAPGEERTFRVEWAPSATLARQGSGVIVVETDGAAPQADVFDPDLRLTVEFDRRPLWMRWLPWLSVLLPALLVACVLLTFRVRRVNDRIVLGAAIGVAMAALAVDAALVATMNRTLGRADGNFGLQHLHRGTAFGAEIFLGLDGINAPFLLAVGVLLVAALAALPSGPAPRTLLIATYGVLAAASKIFVLSQSLTVSTVALAGVASLTLMILFATARGDRRLRGAAIEIGIVAVLGAVAFAVLGHLVVRDARAAHVELGADAAFLPELARLALHAHEEAGAQPSAAPVWVFAVIGLFLGVVPASTWVGRAMSPALAPLAGIFGVLGAIVLGRMTVVLFPEDATYFEQGLAWAGGLTAAFGVTSVMVSRRLDQFIAGGAAIGSGIALLAWSSGTMQGFEAAIVLLSSRAVALALTLLLGSTLADRTGEPDPRAHSGLFQSAPRMSAAWGWAFASTAGIPGGAATLGWLLTLMGTLGRAPGLAVVVALIGIGSAAAMMRVFNMVGGEAPAWWRSSVRLEAHGGTPPDLRAGDWMWTLVLTCALVVMLFGARYWFGSTGRTLLDVFRALSPPGPTQVF